MDAITFLIKEHNRVRKNLSAIARQTKMTKAKINKFNTLCNDLLVHEKMEHKVWYPHFKRSRKIKAEVKHLLSEEKHAEIVIKSFKRIKTEAEWKKRFSKFKKEVEQHAAEEEKKLFPNVQQILDREELLKIGKDMKEFKAKNMKKIQLKSKKTKVN